MRWIIKLLITIIPLVYNQSVKAQENDIEITQGAIWNVSTFKKNGFTVTSYLEKAKGGKEKWKFAFYNTNMDKVDEKVVSINKSFYYTEVHDNADGKSHQLFKNDNDFILYTLDAITHEVKEVRGKFPFDMIPVEVCHVIGDHFLFFANAKKKRLLLSVNWKTGEVKNIVLSLPGYKPKELHAFKASKIDGQEKLAVFSRVSNKNYSDYALIIDPETNQISHFKLPQNQQKKLTPRTIVKSADNEYIISGSYSEMPKKNTEGIYFSKIKNGKVEFIKYHNFQKLETYFLALSDEDKDFIMQREIDLKKKNKNFNLEEFLVSHDIMKLESGYLFIGELYHKTYRQEFNAQTIGNTQYNKQVFDGNQYTYAFIIKLDFNGDIMWDHTLDMHPTYKPGNVVQHIKVAEINEQNLSVGYTGKENYFYSRIDCEIGSITQESEVKIEENFTDKEKKHTTSKMYHWYDDVFLIKVYHKVKLKGKGQENKYFLNKIEH